MNTYTAMAVDAFRTQESLRRRLGRAEEDSLAAQRLVPTEEKGVWFLATEVVRAEFELREAEANRDGELAEIVLGQLADLRKKLAEADAQLEADKALADKEDRVVTPGEARLDDNSQVGMVGDHGRRGVDDVVKPGDRPHGTALGRHARPLSNSDEGIPYAIGDDVPGAADHTASWQAARGAVPRPPGAPRAEDVIRDGR